MKLTMTSMLDENARKQLESMKARRLSKLVEFESHGGDYVVPKIAKHGKRLRDIQIVVGNTAHSRSTNPGYSRKGDGGQYAH